MNESVMDVAEFKRVLEIGLGRAILHLQTHDAAPYRDAILEACLHDTRYDRQAEGPRNDYLFQTITLAGFRDAFREPLLEALRNAPEPDDYDTYQVNGLVCRYAEQGDSEARQLVYDHFVAHLTSDEWGDQVRADNLIRLDGVEDFLFAVERFGERLPEARECDPPYWFSGPEDKWDEDEHAFWDAAVQRAASNPALAAYVEYEQARRARWEANRNTRKPWRMCSYEKLKPRITARTSEVYLRTWGKCANEAELEHAATDFLALPPDTDLVLLRKWLSIFQKRRFPLDPQRLIDMVNQRPDDPVSEDDGYCYTPHTRLTITAIDALGNVSHPAVRALALELLNTRQWIKFSPILLKANWQTGDWALLETLTRERIEPDEYHGLGIDVRNIFKAHPEPEAAPALRNLYEYNTCSFCRESAVLALDSIQAVPEWMRAECRYDANDELREWATSS